MPEVIINYTPSEYGQAQKRKAAKLRDAILTGLVIMTLGCAFGYYALWNMVNH